MTNPAHQAQRRWRSLVENCPETILTIDRSGLIEFINRIEGGMTMEQVLGHRHTDFLPPSEHARIASHIESVFVTGEPVQYDVEAYAPDGSVIGYYSCRAGPVLHEGHVESVVVIANNVTEKHKVDEELLRSRAQLQRLMARQQANLEQEQRRIARELHDELGQLLTALKIDVDWLERHSQPNQLARIHSMAEIIDTTMSSVRRISTRLRPPILDDLGAGPAVDWLVKDVCGRAGLRHRVAILLGNVRLSEEHSLAVFRICQEVLTNTVRHAKASSVEVELRVDGGCLRLCICDDGVGISHQSANGSLGLLGLQERVNLLGGSLSVTGEPERGTKVLALLPLPAEG